MAWPKRPAASQFFILFWPLFVVVAVVVVFVAGSYDAHCRRDVPHLFHVAGSG